MMVNEGRTMSFEFRAHVELVVGLAVDEGSIKQDCACDERTSLLDEELECLAEQIEARCDIMFVLSVVFLQVRMEFWMGAIVREAAG
jgi:hypothetical protein